MHAVPSALPYLWLLPHPNRQRFICDEPRWPKNEKTKESQNWDKRLAYTEHQSQGPGPKKDRTQKVTASTGLFLKLMFLASEHTTEAHFIEPSASSTQSENTCPPSHSRTMVMSYHYQLTDGFASVFFNMWIAINPQTLHPWSFPFPSVVEIFVLIPALMGKVISPGFPHWCQNTIALPLSSSPEAHLKWVIDSICVPKEKASR